MIIRKKGYGLSHNLRNIVLSLEYELLLQWRAKVLHQTSLKFISVFTHSTVLIQIPSNI